MAEGDAMTAAAVEYFRYCARCGGRIPDRNKEAAGRCSDCSRTLQRLHESVVRLTRCGGAHRWLGYGLAQLGMTAAVEGIGADRHTIEGWVQSQAVPVEWREAVVDYGLRVQAWVMGRGSR